MHTYSHPLDGRKLLDGGLLFSMKWWRTATLQTDVEIDNFKHHGYRCIFVCIFFGLMVRFPLVMIGIFWKRDSRVPIQWHKARLFKSTFFFNMCIYSLWSCPSLRKRTYVYTRTVVLVDVKRDTAEFLLVYPDLHICWFCRTEQLVNITKHCSCTYIYTYIRRKIELKLSKTLPEQRSGNCVQKF
jgi:hypothetical protein